MRLLGSSSMPQYAHSRDLENAPTTCTVLGSAWPSRGLLELGAGGFSDARAPQRDFYTSLIHNLKCPVTSHARAPGRLSSTGFARLLRSCRSSTVGSPPPARQIAADRMCRSRLNRAAEATETDKLHADLRIQVFTADLYRLEPRESASSATIPPNRYACASVSQALPVRL
jgi:hypothetical protein